MNAIKQIVARLSVKAAKAKHPEIYEVLWGAVNTYGKPIDQSWTASGPAASFKDGSIYIIISDTAGGIEVEATAEAGEMPIAVILAKNMQELIQRLRAKAAKYDKSTKDSLLALAQASFHELAERLAG